MSGERKTITASEQPTADAGRVDAIKARLNAAALGKWVVQIVDHKSGIKDFDIVEGAEDATYANSMARAYHREVADFIANAPDDIRALLAALAAANARAERAEAALAKTKEQVITATGRGDYLELVALGALSQLEFGNPNAAENELREALAEDGKGEAE